MMIMDAKRSGWEAGSARNIPLSKEYHYQAYVMETLKRRALPWRRVSEGEVIRFYCSILLRRRKMMLSLSRNVAKLIRPGPRSKNICENALV